MAGKKGRIVVWNSKIFLLITILQLLSSEISFTFLIYSHTFLILFCFVSLHSSQYRLVCFCPGTENDITSQRYSMS